MKISTKFKFAFLCTPKCASTSIEEAISEFCSISFSGFSKLKHLNARTYAERILPLHQHLFPALNIESFCMIRDPLEWIQSWYQFRSRAELNNPNHRHHNRYAGNIRYNEFIELYIADGNRPPFARIRTLYEFMRLDNGDIGVDYIFPLDRMDLVSDFISRKTGTTIHLPHRNVSPQTSGLKLDKALEASLRDHLSVDIALYNLVKKNGVFNNAVHGEAFSASLQR